MDAAIVTVGDELLAGETQDTNTTWLAGRLTERGVTVERATTVPDRIEEIARVVGEYREEYDAVVVTGGLGPTHDDVTMAAVAAAFDRALEPHAEALAWLEAHGGYAADDLAEGTVDLPAGARMLPNEAGVAPGAVVDATYVLPGVPEEMKAMFARIESAFEGERLHAETVATGEPESALLDRLDAVRERFDVTVGSYPGENVRLTVRSTDAAEVAAAADWLRRRVDPAEE